MIRFVYQCKNKEKKRLYLFTLQMSLTWSQLLVEFVVWYSLQLFWRQWIQQFSALPFHGPTKAMNFSYFSHIQQKWDVHRHLPHPLLAPHAFSPFLCHTDTILCQSTILLSTSEKVNYQLLYPLFTNDSQNCLSLTLKKRNHWTEKEEDDEAQEESMCQFSRCWYIIPVSDMTVPSLLWSLVQFSLVKISAF